jgi:hypothetical protein
LTPQQQQKLQERIIGEVADYWRHQRVIHSVRLGKVCPTLPFGEREPLGEKDSPLEYGLHPYQTLAFLDRTVAHLESNHLAPVSEVAITLGQRSWDLVQRIKSQLSVLLSGKAQPTGSKLPASNSSEAHTLQIQALIWAAIDYFFGDRSGEQLGQPRPSTKSLLRQSGGGIIRATSASSELPLAQLRSQHGSLAAEEFSPQLSPKLVSDPWLSESDLFGAPESEGEPSSFHEPELSKSHMRHRKTNSALPASQSTGYSVQNLLSRFQGLLRQPKQLSGLVKWQKTTKGKELEKVGTQQLSPVPKSSGSVSAGESSNQPCTQNTQLAPAPDWIETNSTAIGYVKHPLEQLLQCLDRAMLWLEDVLMIVWRSVQQLLRGK